MEIYRPKTGAQLGHPDKGLTSKELGICRTFDRTPIKRFSECNQSSGGFTDLITQFKYTRM